MSCYLVEDVSLFCSLSLLCDNQGILVLLSTLLSAGFSIGNSSSLFVLLSDFSEVDSNFDGGALNCFPLVLRSSSVIDINKEGKSHARWLSWLFPSSFAKKHR